MLKDARFSQTTLQIHENHHSRKSHFMQVVNREITIAFNSRIPVYQSRFLTSSTHSISNLVVAKSKQLYEWQTITHA